ncbi:putative transcription factor FAR family [Rosa chinensis]|uniref:Putative transcription factor FAR family n=1 Tax=Rosa chinensis TaxID=74649 RepID=A0A2P6SB15_ROSCH|nr:putative transcription factor FAR family [Rosa chinensis]
MKKEELIDCLGTIAQSGTSKFLTALKDLGADNGLDDCLEEGHCVSIRGKFGPVRKPRASTREGCKAMIHVKYDKSGKWVIAKFVKEHNHSLVVSPREARQTMPDDKYEFSEPARIQSLVKNYSQILVQLLTLWCKNLLSRSYQKMAWRLGYQGQE